MKKVVKSRSDLNAAALRNGATITDQSGQRFNVAGKKSKAIKKVKPEKKAEPPEAVKETIIVEKIEPDNSMLIADAVERQTLELKIALKALKDQMAEIRANHREPITAWDFKVVIHKNGTMDIEARVPDGQNIKRLN